MSTQMNSDRLDNTTGQLDPWRVMPAQIVRIDQAIPEVRTYHIALTDHDDVARYAIEPGQFNMLYLPGVGEAAISVSGDVRFCQPLIHTIRAVGNVTQSLGLLSAGATLGIRGPFGSSWPMDKCAGKDLLIVAGGIGLAPLRSAIYQIISHRNTFGDVWLLMGARSPEDLLYWDEYHFWKSKGITVQTTVDHAGGDWSGNVGFVTPLLERLELRDPSSTMLLTCGPEIMMRFAAESGTHLGIPTDHIWVTLERNMKCAFGHCGHCQFGPHFVCKDGPVLRYDRVADLLRVDSL